MAPKKTSDSKAVTLRGLAQARLKQTPLPEALTHGDLQRTVHELQVHQIELQMQNEELHRLQTELEMARTRYFDLFDNAPVPYLTLTEAGLIEEANVAASRLLGAGQLALAHQPLANHVHLVDRELFLEGVKQVFRTGDPHAFDLRMVNKKGVSFLAHLEMSALLHDHGQRLLRVTVRDQAAA